MRLRSTLILTTVTFYTCFGGESELPLGSACQTDESCETGLVCIYGRCRMPCQFDSHCDEGEVCVPSTHDPPIMACTFSDESCSTSHQCPPGFICDLRNERCRGVVDLFDDLTLSGQDTWQDPRHEIDLLRSDITLGYTLDLSSFRRVYATPEDASALVGLHDVGADDLHPGPWDTYQGGEGGWMASYVLMLDANPGAFDLNDKHFLAASGERGEPDYDVLVGDHVEDASFGSHESYGFWFDRDGVSDSELDNWGWENGGNCSTGGIYRIEIAYHAVSDEVGTMMASVNGVFPGFYVGGFHEGPPDIVPAGLSFRGNLSRMQLFVGNGAPDDEQGPIAVRDIVVIASPPSP